MKTKIVEKVKEINPEHYDTIGVTSVAVLIGLMIILDGSVILTVLASVVIAAISFAIFFASEILEHLSEVAEELIDEITDDEEDEFEEEVVEEVVEETPVDLSSLSIDGPDTLQLGFLDGQPVRQRVGHIGNIFIAGMTRYGKTREMYGLIYDLITNNEPEDILLGFSDAKVVSFAIFDDIKHLFAPVATTAEETERLLILAKKEMNRRLTLFSEYSGKICTNIDEYRDLSGEKLPRIFLFFDEAADSIPPNSDAEEMITTIAKMGLATGIHLVIATQRPTAKGISHEVQSQCATTLCTYMRDWQDYKIAKIPSEVSTLMTATKGLFMLFSPETAPVFKELSGLNGWGFVMGNYIENDEMERAAASVSTGTSLKWSGKKPLPSWGGNAKNKLKTINLLVEQLGRDVTAEDLNEAFDISIKTATIWKQRYYDNSTIDNT